MLNVTEEFSCTYLRGCFFYNMAGLAAAQAFLPLSPPGLSASCCFPWAQEERDLEGVGK